MITYVFFWATSLFSGLLIRGRIATHIFFILVFLFVGLRLETGFDWPVYKSIHQIFQESFTLTDVVLVSAFYGQEMGFLFSLGFTSYYFQSLEMFQAIVTILLLWSTAFLARTAGVQKLAMVIAIMMTYLMWSVGFSTLRQSMAISFFNFGLAFFMRKQRFSGVAFFIAAVSFQMSSLIYIAAFILSRLLWRKNRPLRLRTFLIAAIGATAVLPIAMQAISMVSVIAAEKLEYYLALAPTMRFGLFEIFFALFFAAATFMVSSRMSRSSDEDAQGNDIPRLIMLLAAIGISTTFFAVMRDRISYEVFLLASIYLMTPGVRYRYYFVIFFVCFGLLHTSMSIFPYPARIAFEPYQNVIISYVFDQPSTGPERNGAFMEIHEDMMEVQH